MQDAEKATREQIKSIDSLVKHIDNVLVTVASIRTKARMHVPPLWCYDMMPANGTAMDPTAASTVKVRASLDLAPNLMHLDPPHNFTTEIRELQRLTKNLDLQLEQRL